MNGVPWVRRSSGGWDGKSAPLSRVLVREEDEDDDDFDFDDFDFDLCEAAL
jgi:hypothetical protein